MYIVGDGESRGVESVDDLVEYFTDACKPPTQWKVGTEVEMIGVYRHGSELGSAPSYHGDRGVGHLLEDIQADGWRALREGPDIIALTRDGQQIALEPGGQLEYAGRPHDRSREFYSEARAFLHRIAACSRRLGIAWLTLGFRPFGTLDEVPWMPKRRYELMRSYLPTRGALAHEMMKRTATVQVNLDYSDAEDAGRKLRAAYSVTSVLTAIFANSPVVNGKIVDYQSYRAHVWTDTDRDRCGFLPFIFDDGDVFRAYAEWALDVPMFFVHRDDYLPAGGITFRDFLKDGFRGHRATMDDWGLHLSTLFPEVRMKGFLEVRGCDAGTLTMAAALGALTRGYLYDQQAAEEAIRLTERLDLAGRIEFAAAVAARGLSARLPGTQHRVQDLAASLLAIAEDGLRRQAPGELHFLDPIRAVIDSGRTQADEFIDLWKSCSGDPARVIAARSHDID